MKSAVENDRTFSLYQRLNIMRIPRIYHPESLKNQSTCQLADDAANHVGRVPVSYTQLSQSIQVQTYLL